MSPSTPLNIHPDDLLFFNEVAAAMRRVAKSYNLPLRSIKHLTMPKVGMADCLGNCNGYDINLVLRCSEDGVWCESPMSPAEVWDTAAHELAHLRHLNHGMAFQEFRLELVRALANGDVDHRQKVLDKLIKIQALRESEAAIGNIEAAESFAAAINKMLLDYELNPSDIDYARATDRDPVIELRVNLGAFGIEKKKTRCAWQESLARIVANAHLCTYLLKPGSNQIWFVGTKSHATVAEYTFGILVPAADKMATTARNRYDYECRVIGNERGKDGARGFRESWLSAFLQRINERFTEARKAAIVAAPDGSNSTALVRLNGAMVKVQTYIDNKFKSKKGVSPLNGMSDRHPVGRERGRAAADSMTIGRRGVEGGSQKRLGTGSAID